jgi:hypothetical protein
LARQASTWQTSRFRFRIHLLRSACRRLLQVGDVGRDARYQPPAAGRGRQGNLRQRGGHELHLAGLGRAQIADIVDKALAASGWQQYVAPNTATTKDPSLRIMSLKKDTQALNVFITIAPAQNNATSVQYSAVPLKTDLPFTKDASELEYSPDRPSLALVTAEPVDKILNFYRKELGARGWSLWSEKLNAKQPADAPSGTVHERSGYAHYVNDNEPLVALVVTLQRAEAGKFKVELKEWPIGILEAEHKAYLNQQKPQETAPAVFARPPAVKIAGINEDWKKPNSATDALAGMKSPPALQAPDGPEMALRVLAENTAPVPLPEAAEDVEFDGAEGKLEFNSGASVKSVAEFYRSTMKQHEWDAQSSVINNANMVVLNFSKGRKAVSFTIMQIGSKVNVTADGSALKTAAAKPAVADAAPSSTAEPAQAPAPATAKDLEAEESAGLPVPKRHTSTEGNQTPFRRELTASVPLDLAAVLGFYRRELGKLNWKEETKGAEIAADRAVIAFTSADGPAVLKLGSKDGATSVSLAVKNPAAVAKNGLLPKPGQAKVLFGNMLPTDAVVTINKKTVKVAAGAGFKGPDGKPPELVPGKDPILDLAPGKYAYSIKLTGMPARNDELEIGADETWGLMIGPGGALPLHMY